MENNQDNRQRFAALIREHSHSMFRAGPIAEFLFCSGPFRRFGNRTLIFSPLENLIQLVHPPDRCFAISDIAIYMSYKR